MVLRVAYWSFDFLKKTGLGNKAVKTEIQLIFEDYVELYAAENILK